MKLSYLTFSVTHGAVLIFNVALFRAKCRRLHSRRKSVCLAAFKSICLHGASIEGQFVCQTSLASFS
jgi:hypothetical protein